MNKILLIAFVVALSSCSVIPNRMFKTPSDFAYSKDTLQNLKGPYIIQVDDRIDLHIFSNDGFRLVDVTTTNMSQLAATDNVDYIVEEDGEAKLPVIGRIHLQGLSIKESENLLQEKYSKYYKEPFVLIRVVSRHAIVFLADGGKGTVVPLQNDHTSLFEALAAAGGLTDFSKAYKIKIIRGDYKNPRVYLADVSSIQGLKNSELQVYPNDIIYVDAGSGFTRRISTEFLPYVSFLASLLVLITYFKN